MQIAVTMSVQRSNSRTMMSESTKRMGPDMSVKGEIMRSTMSTACTPHVPVTSVLQLSVPDNLTTHRCL